MGFWHVAPELWPNVGASHMDADFKGNMVEILQRRCRQGRAEKALRDRNT
jgi:hypothetical protein